MAFTGASGAVGATAACASAIGESDLGLKRVIPPSAEANAKVRGAGSPGASVQSAGNRRFTVSDGGISAKVRATVEDGSAGSPARVLEPANRPPTVAPPRRARHAITPVLIRLDRPRMSTHARCPQWPSSCFQTERNYGCGGTFLRSFLCSARGLRPMTRQLLAVSATAPLDDKKSPAFPPGSFISRAGRLRLMPPLPPLPPLRPQPHPRQASDLGGDPWQGQPQSP